MDVQQGTCASCETPIPEGTAYCPGCGVSTPTAISRETGADRTPHFPQADAREHRERLQRALGTAYELRELVGQGGFGTVYAGWDVELERDVAIKALRFDLFPTPELIKRFKREARAVAKLRHPNIVPVYTVGEGEGLAYFIMPLIEGTSLRDVLEREETLPIDETCRILVEAANALEAAHQVGIVHRDIKPENILLEGEGRRVLLMDFGIAKAATAGETGITGTGMIVGTPQYMSPEQATGERDIDGRSDIYSLGVVGYQLLSGQLPFDATSIQQLIYQHVATEPTDIRTVRSDIPPALGTAIMRCLAKSPDDRWANPAQFIEALEPRVDTGATTGSQTGELLVQTGLARLLDGMRRPKAAILGLGSFLVLAAAVGWSLNHSGNIRWARQEAIPQIEALIAEEQFPAALALAERAERYIGGDSALSQLLPRTARHLSITTSPSNADVYFKELADTGGAWKPLGQSPIDSVRLPLGYKRWRVEKAGFVTVESFSAAGPAVDFRLEEEGTAPPNMIRIPAKGLRVSLHGFPAYTERIEAPDYWIDKHEVTNREFKVFIDSGGYENRDYWKHDFEDGGRALSWEHAMMGFHDRTGRPGPLTWEGGTYPAGQDNYPVSGVSWYEAAAYAEFAGKSLPTIYHWLGATSIGSAAQILPYSNIDNIEGNGPTSVGAYQPGRFGVYDMAGNVREWMWNRSGSSRYVLGGAWNEPVYMFYEADVRSALDRSPGNGFRGVQYPGGQAQLAEAFTRPVEFAEFAALDSRAIEPASDELFEAYRSQYSYDPTPLEAVTEALDESPTYWRKEKVSFNAAYGGERVIAHLFLPANIEPPYQAVVYWPYSGAILQPSSDNLSYLSAFDFVIKSGRVVVYPVYKGSYERNPGVTTWVPNTSRFYADHIIQAVQDLMRSVDYLESRADIDAESIAYYGTSWGAFIGPIPLALETRFKAGILVAGGFVPMEARPEVTEFNFAPRVKAPVLMINGRYDYLFPLESNQEPMFDLLGTPEEHKRHILYEAGHGVLAYRIDQIKENVLEWLDRYLGMVN